ncbi:hypothetical protein ACFX2F_042481 [Malus domestica]
MASGQQAKHQNLEGQLDPAGLLFPNFNTITEALEHGGQGGRTIVWSTEAVEYSIVEWSFVIRGSGTNPNVAGSSSCFGGLGEKSWKKIWNASVPGKVKICVWRACLDSLSTRLNLSKRKVLGEVACVVCGVPVEAVEHVLRNCNLARAVWFRSLGLRVDNGTNPLPWGQLGCFKNGRNLGWDGSNVILMVHGVKVVLGEGYGVVVRDHTGGFLGATTGPIEGSTLALQLELIAARHAVEYFKRFWSPVVKVIFERGSSVVVAAMAGKGDDDSGLGTIINDLRYFFLELPYMECGYIQREGNSVAHRLARMGTGCFHDVLWFEEPPDLIHDLLFEESM